MSAGRPGRRRLWWPLLTWRGCGQRYMWALDSTALADGLAIGVIHKGGSAIKCLLGTLPLEEDGVSLSAFGSPSRHVKTAL